MVALDPLREGVGDGGGGGGGGAVEVIAEGDEGVPPQRGGHRLGAGAVARGRGGGAAARHGR